MGANAALIAAAIGSVLFLFRFLAVVVLTKLALRHGAEQVEIKAPSFALQITMAPKYGTSPGPSGEVECSAPGPATLADISD